MKPTLKAPGTERLKLNCDILLSMSPFKLNLRRYDSAESIHRSGYRLVCGRGLRSFQFQLNLSSSVHRRTPR
jgi:hypothetical protein